MDKNRFKQLLESELGNVKPLITEENETINFLLRRWDLFKKRFELLRLKALSIVMETLKDMKVGTISKC
jgi:hypothetical protein